MGIIFLLGRFAKILGPFKFNTLVYFNVSYVWLFMGFVFLVALIDAILIVIFMEETVGKELD